jgi:hypothetical protein
VNLQLVSINNPVNGIAVVAIYGTTNTLMTPNQLNSEFRPYYTTSGNYMFWHDYAVIKLNYLFESLNKIVLATERKTWRSACWRAPRPGRVARACLRDLRCHERTRQGTVGPSLQLCLYETRVVNS